MVLKAKFLRFTKLLSKLLLVAKVSDVPLKFIRNNWTPGCYDPIERKIMLDIRGCINDLGLVVIMAHELGHALWKTHSDSPRETRWVEKEATLFGIAIIKHYGFPITNKQLKKHYLELIKRINAWGGYKGRKVKP